MKNVIINTTVAEKEFVKQLNKKGEQLFAAQWAFNNQRKAYEVVEGDARYMISFSMNSAQSFGKGSMLANAGKTRTTIEVELVKVYNGKFDSVTLMKKVVIGEGQEANQKVNEFTSKVVAFAQEKFGIMNVSWR